MKSEGGVYPARDSSPAAPSHERLDSKMIISDKQQEANRRNAQHSTGPITPAGKAPIYGLRTSVTILERENAAD